MFPCVAFSDGGAVIGNLIQDVELRSQYNFENKEYNNTLRMKLGTLKSGAKIDLLERQKNRENFKMLFLNASSKLQKNLYFEVQEITHAWKRPLKRVYRAYKEYLKSHPSAARNSVEADVSEILLYAEGERLQGNVLSAGNVLSLNIDKEAHLQRVRTSSNGAVELLGRSYASDRNFIKFLEIGVKGSYEQSGSTETLARVGLSLPLGFTGLRRQFKKKMALEQYKVKINQVEDELRLKQISREFRFKKKLYSKLRSKIKTKKEMKKMISSTSLSAADKVRIYIDAIKFSNKVLELKYKVASLYNEALLLSQESDAEKFIGLSELKTSSGSL